jgi:hypothetical protein
MATARNAQRSMEVLREQGYRTAKVEYYNSFIKRGPEGAKAGYGKRIDLYGIIDILAIRTGEILGVQSASNHANVMAHQRKYLGDEYLSANLKAWLEAGGKFQIWAWDKKTIVGVKKKWYLFTIELVLKDLQEGIPI